MIVPPGAPHAAAAAARESFPATVDALRDLVAIPSVSAPGFDPAEVTRSADASATVLEAAGLPDVRLLEIPGAPPYVTGAWTGAPGAPTVLLYAHHDVQPAGIAENWTTPPFRPDERDGRLYGRGSADDKAGVVAHAAAVSAWLETAGALPVNVKVVIEGEEETGSTHLEEFLERHGADLAADVIVLADAGNWRVGTPGITYSLRGLADLVVAVRALDSPAHSGLAGGFVPDPVLGLARMLAGLVDDSGDVAVPGFGADARVPSAAELARIRSLPDPDAGLRRAFGVRPGVVTAGGDGPPTVYERLWLTPTVTVVGVASHPIAGSSNQVVAAASARLGIRLAPGQDPARAVGLLRDHLAANVPWGLEASFAVGEAAPGWVCEPTGPAFEAAGAALTTGFGKAPVLMGMGGSIPFVGPFAAAFGGVPALLVGPGDPSSRVHGEDESVDLDDLRKLVESEVHLLAEIAARM